MSKSKENENITTKQVISNCKRLGITTMILLSIFVASAAATLNPSEGPPGTHVTATGSVSPGKDTIINASWDNPATNLGGTHADANGNWVINFDIPSGAGIGDHSVRFATSFVGGGMGTFWFEPFRVTSETVPTPTPTETVPTPTPTSTVTVTPTPTPTVTPTVTPTPTPTPTPTVTVTPTPTPTTTPMPSTYIKKAPFEFNTEQSGLVSCNREILQVGHYAPIVYSDPDTGNLLIYLLAMPTDVNLVTPEKADDTSMLKGEAGVGIKYLAPKDGTLKISTNIDLQGSDYAQLLKFGKYPVMMPTAVEVALNSAASLHVYRFGPRKDDISNKTFQDIYFSYSVVPTMQTLINILWKIPLPISMDTGGKKYTYSQDHVTDSLSLKVKKDDMLYVCAGVVSEARSVKSIFPGVNYATVDYNAKVKDISITYQ